MILKQRRPNYSHGKAIGDNKLSELYCWTEISPLRCSLIVVLNEIEFKTE